MAVELVARCIVAAAAAALLVTGVTVLVFELKNERPEPVERSGGPLAAVNFVGILGFVAAGLVSAIWMFGTVRWIPGSIATAIRMVGIICVGVAGLLAMWGLRSIGRQMSSRAEVRPDTQLVTSGAFGLVRHPLYLSILLLWASGAFALLSWFMAACTLLLVPLFVARSRLEEQLLLRYFGGAYVAYVSRVPMLLPSWPLRRSRPA